METTADPTPERTYGAIRGVNSHVAPRGTRPRLTPHQREVYARIVRQSRHNGHALAENVGSTGAVEHMVEKGYVRKDLAYTGPRGREFYHLVPLVDLEKWAALFARLEA